MVIDGQYIAPQRDHDKITYECGCLDQAAQDIVWEFVLSDDSEKLRRPRPRDSSPPQVQRTVTPRVKVVMQRQKLDPVKTTSLARADGVVRFTPVSQEGSTPYRHTTSEQYAAAEQQTLSSSLVQNSEPKRPGRRGMLQCPRCTKMKRGKKASGFYDCTDYCSRLVRPPPTILMVHVSLAVWLDWHLNA